MPLPSDAPRIAIVRFSALGDIALIVPAVRALQRSLPQAELTWITSPLGYALLEGLPGVRFEIFQKPRSLSDYRNFYRSFRGRQFDVVLAMQANLRINLLYPALHAPVKIGFDRIRAREGQWLFCNRAIPFVNNHLVDSFLAFAEQLGADIQEPDYALPLSDADRTWASSQVQHLSRPLVAIHPCSSKKERNWAADNYAALMIEAQRRWNCSFVLTGGDNRFEHGVCNRLADFTGNRVLNLCGQSTPKQFAALMGSVDALIAPDTAAVHFARAAGTPVIGLYAVAPPELTGPHRRNDFLVNRYPEAVRHYLRKDPDHAAWNTRVHHPDAMSLIKPEDVLMQLERILGK